MACNWARLSCCLSFLWAFWWPPRACELANSRQQYWHSYLRSVEGVNTPDSDDPVGVLAVVESSSSNSSRTSKPKSFNFKRVVVVVVVVVVVGVVWFGLDWMSNSKPAIFGKKQSSKQRERERERKKGLL